MHHSPVIQRLVGLLDFRGFLVLPLMLLLFLLRLLALPLLRFGLSSAFAASLIVDP